MCKNLNNHHKVNSFLALVGESVSSSWNRFTVFVRDVSDNRIDDESLKEYFYKGKYDNKKSMLNTISGGSYRECTYTEIAKMLEKISCNNYYTFKMN